MTPPRVPPLPRMVQLKHSVDVQLDRSFHEQQWTIVANLARQRYKATKDEYYKAVEIAAKSRGDNATDLTAGREAVEAMINDNTIIKDVDALDLYEFAVDGLSMDYSKTIGVLRSRLAKALPKDRTASLKCLEACMWNSDWENAQEIAVSLNKNFPGDRNLLFQNILITSLVAISDSTHENKQKLFANLAKAQVDRAFNLRPPTGKEQTPSAPIATGEDEVKLWIKIQERFGSPQEILKLCSLPNWGPLFFLESGFTDAFLMSIRLLTTNSLWEEVTRVAYIIFDYVITVGHPTNNFENQEDKRSAIPELLDNGSDSTTTLAAESAVQKQYIIASREWFLWKSALNAITRNLSNREQALEAFHEKIKKLFRVLMSKKYVESVFEQNYDQILLDITFARASIATELFCSKSEETNRVQCLLKFAKKYMKGSSCFTTLKGYLEVLNKEEITNFVGDLGIEHTKNIADLNLFDKLSLTALSLRVEFFQATSLEVGEECRVCHSLANKGPDCEPCLKSIAGRALDAFSVGVQDEETSRKAAADTEDPLSNFAVLGSICLIKLAGTSCEKWRYMKESPLYHTDMQLFLQAVVWLDFYMRKTRKNDPLRMLLVKLYLMMGCVTRALDIWGSFGVKNTLLECLGTVCLDRLASISPSHFMTGPSSTSNFAEPFIRHFETALQKRYPDTVTKILQSGSYAELPEIIELAQSQSHNCVPVLAVVEYRRGMRLNNNRTGTLVQDEPLISSLCLDNELLNFTDYSPLPHWAGTRSTPIQELVAYGPLPTNRRCHLSILAERFLDLVGYVQPKEVKPSKASQLLYVDLQAAVSSCRALHKSLDTLVSGEGYDERDLTGPETWYFRIVTELPKLVKLILDTIILPASSAKTTKDEVLAVSRRILSIIDYQTYDFLAVPDGIPARMHTLHGVAALHAMGMLRESSLAMKTTLQYVSATFDRVKAADKTRGTSEIAWITAETKKLSLATSAADAQMKSRVKKLTENLHTSGWVDRLEGWAFGDNALPYGDDADFKSTVAGKLAQFIPSEAREVWAMDIADSWRDVMKGWGAVRFD
ncbi:N-acetyltransferase B complex non catalytic subunit-domain-containing protein [Xylaria sp. FL0064]|nr:N-acetyltransferase B complex non catalytic subunit-domain-containing protein [Xylaria sp. FL0064]